ncbi:FKBP-type peptidyl-prolyl cis-trans isomerase [Mucilaginibacter yixingensis]|uniref:peptidylprolyl isomerase n=1 Tax=Mucilaginibacter yixingensis TaxID=1295612 RepID=A0A2T5J514_9SPHI|nr:FKBP-type peptidyl-prolyl cis-trans isomerase [Mucilaginibacter yixingensis]PTQ92686.1 FKBP-type peptidyl-prolyl cis-trans isomerase [Mucilaginibacter yixingensis]
MKKNLMFLFTVAVALAACNSGFKKGPGGLLYNIHEDKSGQNMKEGDFIYLNMIIKNDADSVMMSTYNTGRAIPTILPKPQNPGDIYAGLALLSEGDSATVKINADSIFKAGQPKPPGFKGKFLVYQIKVEKVIAKGKLDDVMFRNRINEFFKGLADQAKKEEPGKIAKYVADNKLDVKKTASGLNYVITKPGSGPTPVAGDTVEVSYVGKLTSGKAFETNIKAEAEKDKSLFNPMNPYKPFKFAIGQHQVVPGWDEGLSLMNKGAKATLIFPSSLGYGEQGNGPIGPFTPLVFEVELVNIIKPDPNAKPATPPAPPAAAQLQAAPPVQK